MHNVIDIISCNSFFFKILFLSNLYIQHGALNLEPRDQELHAPPTESARHAYAIAFQIS